MMTMLHQIKNINKKVKITKKNQIAILEQKKYNKYSLSEKKILKREIGQQKEQWDTMKIKSNMADVNPVLLIILNVKKQSKRINYKTYKTNELRVHETYFIFKDTNRLKVKEYFKISQKQQIQENQSVCTILLIISHTKDFKTPNFTRDIERHFIMIKS